MTVSINGSNGASLEASGDLRLDNDIYVECPDPEIVLNNTGSAGGYWRVLGGSTNGSIKSFRVYDGDANQTRLEIDSAGRVTMPYQPCIAGQMGTAMIQPSAAQVLKFDEFWVNQGGIAYNSSTGRFTVPMAGNYRIAMNPFKTTGAGATRVLIGVNTDTPSENNHRGHSYSNDSSFYETNCLNSVVALSANDYIVFYLKDGTLYNQATDRFNQFSIELIG